MPTCIRCGEWSPPSSRDSACPVCGGELVSDKSADPARRERALEEEHFRELFPRRDALTPQETSEYEDILDRRAARKGMSRHNYAAALEEKERELERGRAAYARVIAALVLGGIVGMIALILLVVWWLIG